MYLTKIPDVDGDHYFAHQRVLDMFGGAENILFQRTRRGEILVLSKSGFSSSKDVRSIIESVKTGKNFLFNIRLNSVARKNKQVDGKSIRHTDLIPFADLNRWISEKFKAHGFSSVFSYVPEGVAVSVKNGQKVFAGSVFATGSLVVEDDEKFRLSLVNGIGRSKYLGFGLLNIFDVL